MRQPADRIAQQPRDEKRAAHAEGADQVQAPWVGAAAASGARRATAAGTAELNTSSPKLKTTVPAMNAAPACGMAPKQRARPPR